MKVCHALAALTIPVALFAMGPARASNVFTGSTTLLRAPQSGLASVSSSLPQSSLAGTGPTVLLNSVGFVQGSQVLSDAINVPTAGTLTVTLAGIPWLDALQNLNCFVSAPGGGIIGSATNGGLDSVQVQPGTVYVNWYAQASAPLLLGVYSVSASLQPAAPPPPPVPLPPALPLLISGLAALALGLRQARPVAAAHG
jgi:hypothetical protein